MGVKFKAQVWKVSRDHDDEVTLVLKIPSEQALTVIGLPTNEVINVEVSNAKEE